MEPLEFARLILNQLPYEPNSQQVQLVAALARFYLYDGPGDLVFLINGYAGTGKTSLTGALVRAVESVGRKAVLLAPTGRAAKVFASYARHPAYTIHRQIYRMNVAGMSHVADNRYRDTLFIVDEASMIGAGSDGGENLLQDLIHYVYTGENCRLLLLGDVAQLPPVGCVESPAMDVGVLKGYGLRVSRAVLTETVRQASASGILYNATWLRRAMRADPLPMPKLTVSPFDDVKAVEGEELEDEMSGVYYRDGVGETVLITRSNKRATAFNQAIRSAILGRDGVIGRDELLMVAKNNYHWSAKVAGLDFIANGDIATVTKVYGRERRYEFEFADVALHFPYRDIEIDAKLLLDTMWSDTASLPAVEVSALARCCLEDPEFAPATDSPSAQRAALKSNPYFNALQVKYAYAVTCHKAQGGQWKNVFVDMGYIPPEALGIDFYRWLYTATTRAVSKIYFVSPTVEVR